MALSGTINGTVTQKSNYFSFYISWSATQNVSENYSDVTVKTYWKTSNTYQDFDTVGSRNASITINGTAASISKVFAVYWSKVGNPYLIQTATQRVYHNSDGTKSITISARANGYAASWGPSSSAATSADCTASGTITLDTIPRASSLSLSASSVNVGSSITATITRASSNFTHTVEFYINNTYRQEYTGVTTSRSFTIPTSWYAAMPSSTSCTAYCRITTYNGSTPIGSKVTKSFTVNIPSTIVPTVGTITLTPQTYNILIQNKNTVKVAVSGCSASTGSSIKSYTFSGPGVSSTTTNTSVTSGVVAGTGTQTYTVTVTDNRGRTASKTATITCYAYAAPSFKSFNAYRVNSAGNSDDSGTYVKCDYALSYASVNNTNKVTVQIMYKQNTASSYSSTTALSAGTSTSGSKTLSSISLSSTYNIYAKITDTYGGASQSVTVTVFSAERILNVRPNGSGIAFGKMAESNNLLESKWPAKFDAGITIGTSTQDSAPASGIAVHDVRNATITPNSFGDKNANFYFDQISSTWHSILHMKGWAGEYAAWELAGNAHNTSRDNSLKYRQGLGSTWGSWQKVVTSVDLYSSTGTTGTITFSSSATNYSYLEIFYTDNNSRQANSVKIYSPNGKYVTLSCVEPSTTNDEPRIYIRTSGWTISGTSMTPGRSDLSGQNQGVYGQFYPDAGGVGTKVDVKTTKNNYIKIVKVVGYV